MSSSWRIDIAIPILKRDGIDYFNPKDEEWSPELIGREVKAKETSAFLLYVLDHRTRGIASMLEAADFIINKRSVVLVISDFAEGMVLAGHPVQAPQVADLNEGRSFLKDIAKRNNKTCDLFTNISDAMEFIVSAIQNVPIKVDGACQTALTGLRDASTTDPRLSVVKMTKGTNIISDPSSVFSPAPSPEMWPPFRPCPLEVKPPSGPGPVSRNNSNSTCMRSLFRSANSAFDVVPPLPTRDISSLSISNISISELSLPKPRRPKSVGKKSKKNKR